MQRLFQTFTIGVLSLVMSTAAWAQATAQINGRVTDESGAVLPGVTVTVTQTDTGLTRTVVTDGEGAYQITNLPTGPYRLEVALQGFRTYAQTGIVLQVGATPTLNVALGLGDFAETVTVEAAAPLVDVRSSGISDVVENERIVELPLQGRQVTDLIVLAGAAVATDLGNSAARATPGSAQISVAGGLSVRRRLFPRWRAAQRLVQQPEPAASVPGCAPGVQGGHERPLGTERRALRGVGQCRDEVGHQSRFRQRVRVPARPSVQRDQPVRRCGTGRQAAG